jgi:hypothetical protein
MSTESMKGILTAGRTSARPAFASRAAAGDDLARDPALVASLPQEISPDNADLSESLDSNTALLIVTKTTSEGMPAFQLYFHHGGVPQSAAGSDQLARQRPDPGLSLGALTAQARQSPRVGHWREAYGKLRNWWTGFGLSSLSTWLGGLVDADGDPRLIVWDETDYEIPWELFYRDPRALGAGQGRAGWLGELIKVIRWTTTASAAPPWHYVAQDRQCDGEILIAERVTSDEQADNPFSGYPVMAHFGGLREMLIELGKDDFGTFSLVIVNVHGGHSQPAAQYTLDGVPLNELDEYPMDALAKSGALVLLNACASGRPWVDPANHLAVPRSFVEVFLRSGAGGVIATAADIDLNQRHEFAIRLVDSAMDRDVNIAEALRIQRADQARKARDIRALRDEADMLREEVRLERDKPPAERARTGAELDQLDRTIDDADKKVDDAYKWFFAWFAYLYFGHPGTVLRVRIAGRP